MAGTDPRGMNAGKTKKSKNWSQAKTKDLTDKQLGQARRLVGPKRSEAVTAKELRAAKSDFVNISSTRWLSAEERGGKGRGGLLVDSSGAPVTGTVTLPSGKAVRYVRGKRIGAMKANGSGRGKTPPPSSPPSGSRIAKPSASQRAKGMAAMQERRPNAQAALRKGRDMTVSLRQERAAAKRYKKPKVIAFDSNGNPKGWQ